MSPKRHVFTRLCFYFQKRKSVSVLTTWFPPPHHVFRTRPLRLQMLSVLASSCSYCFLCGISILLPLILQALTFFLANPAFSLKFSKQTPSPFAMDTLVSGYFFLPTQELSHFGGHGALGIWTVSKNLGKQSECLKKMGNRPISIFNQDYVESPEQCEDSGCLGTFRISLEEAMPVLSGVKGTNSVQEKTRMKHLTLQKQVRILWVQ